MNDNLNMGLLGQIVGFAWSVLGTCALAWFLGWLIWWPLSWAFLGISFLGLFGPSLFMWATKQLTFLRRVGPLFEFAIVPESWLDRRFEGKWAAMCMGIFNWYVDAYKDSQRTVKHERRHAEQFLKLGIFQPLLYHIFFVLFVYFFFADRHPYYDNFFEWDARKAAGQTLDIPWQEWKDSDDRWIWW